MNMKAFIVSTEKYYQKNKNLFYFNPWGFGVWGFWGFGGGD